jgi:RNA polymerase sigma-70 factor (ECF subfamily)
MADRLGEIAFLRGSLFGIAKPTCMDAEDPREREIELLREVARGNRQSFSELYDRFASVLFATALSVTRQHDLAEEVVQDAFVQIWQKAALYDPARSKPLTWAIALTRNRAIDRLRALQRGTQLRERFQNETPQPAFDAADAFQLTALADSSARAREALKKLPLEQQQAIELVVLQGCTMPEAAQRLGETLLTIKGRVRRGLIRLRELVASQL